MAMSGYKYISNRTVANRAGQENGSLAVAVKADADVADVRYRCPECQHQEQRQQEWKRPFMVKCRSCGFVMRLPKLRNQMKKEKKAE